MSKFTLLISKGAERDLAQLPKFARRSLEVAFAELELLENPREKLGPLKGRAKGLYSLRTGE